MEKDIGVIGSTGERAQLIAETLLTRSILERNNQPCSDLSTGELIQLEIDESGWENVTEQDVRQIIGQVAQQVDKADLENWTICTYSRLNRDFGIKYEGEVDPTASVDDVDEEAMEMAMSFEEVVEFCRTANRGDRCRFLNLDEEEGNTPETVSSALRKKGIHVSVIPQVTAQLGNYFIIVVLGEVIKNLLR